MTTIKRWVNKNQAIQDDLEVVRDTIRNLTPLGHDWNVLKEGLWSGVKAVLN